MSKRLNWNRWCYGICRSFVSGGASALSAWFGTMGLNTIGVNIPAINYQQAAAMFVTAGVVHMVFYLRDNPVPVCEPEGGQSETNKA